MEHRQLTFTRGFDVVAGNERSQAATMVLAPGSATGGPTNAHQSSDQWLYVLSGEGRAIIEGEQVDLRNGSLVLIEAGETHEIANTGDAPLETLNVYVPPTY